MFCVLEEERTKFRKKKKEKKKKTMADKSGLVGIKGSLKTYNRVKYFFAVLKPFLIETAFDAKLSGRFSGPKTNITRLIA